MASQRIDSLEAFFDTYGDVRFTVGASYRYMLIRWGFPNEENFWAWREFMRFATDEYTAVNIPSNPDHFLHLSIQSDIMIAASTDPVKAKRDIQIRTKPGRYMAAYLGDTLTVSEIQSYTAEFNSHYCSTVVYARTTDSILDIYMKGPHSCMAKQPNEFNNGGIHPTCVYATPDFGVAGLYDSVGDRYLARAVVCYIDGDTPSHYTRIYGDSEYAERLKDCLTDDGFSYDDNFIGFRIQAIPSEGEGDFVAPYIDGTHGLTRQGPYFVVCGDHEGEYMADSEWGYASLQGTTCACCDEIVPETDTTSTVDGDVCCDCMRSYIPATDRYGNSTYVHEESDAIFANDGSCFVDEYAAEYAGYSTCEMDYEWYPSSELIESDLSGSCYHEQYMTQYFDRGCITRNATLEEIQSEHMVEIQGLYFVDADTAIEYLGEDAA